MGFNYNNIFNIPERSLLNKRLTKAFFLKNFALSPAEKKLLNNSIQSMEWMASIKTTNANIPAVKNDEYIYEEIQVMVCKLGGGLLTDSRRCIELFQKYIPYQMVVVVEDENDFVINVCDKRVNLNDKTKRTIENYFTTPIIPKLYKQDTTSAFFDALKFEALDKTNLETTYKNYIQSVVQYQAAEVTGNFEKRTQKRTEQDMADLLEIENLEKEIIGLTSQLKKESQLNGKVKLNVIIQNKRIEIEKIKKKLG